MIGPGRATARLLALDLGGPTHDLAAVPASEARTHPHHTLSRVDVAAAQSRRLAPTTPGGAGRTLRVQHRQGLSFSSLVAADREGPDAFYPADTPQTAKPSTTLIWEGPLWIGPRDVLVARLSV